jgi:hypothetical protein
VDEQNKTKNENEILSSGGEGDNLDNKFIEPPLNNDSGKEINPSGSEEQGREQIIQSDAVLQQKKKEYIEALTPPVVIEEEKKESGIKTFFKDFFREDVF